ncbi:hypothetical protein BGX28_009137 [Mortierella sp. GBA30]|nr:hypothetical protein BGX28_009137 [Mortierella sp. GBA30]
MQPTPPTQTSLSSSLSSSQPLQSQQQQPTYFSSAILLLDITTVQGLALYTLYLLHKLRFFRWKDAWRLSQILAWAQPHEHPDININQDQPDLKSDADPTARVVGQESIQTTEEERPCCNSLDGAGDDDSQFTPGGCSAPSYSATLSSSSGGQGEKEGGEKVFSINDRLPPEILVLVFEQLSRPRTLLKCMLVCRTWYQLLGPRIWKAPRMLWSRHWSRFFPHPVIMTTTGPDITTEISSWSVNNDDAAESTRGAHTSEGNNTFPLQDQLLLLHQQHNRQQHQQPQQQQPQQGFHDPVTALGSGQLHDLDRQELERWLEWKKRERLRRIHEHKRRSRRKIKQENPGVRAGNRKVTVMDVDDDSENEDGNEDEEEHESEEIPESESETEYDNTSDEETTLMKMVSGMDYLQSLGVSLESVKVLAHHCPAIQWLDLARSGKLNTECLLMLAERCFDLEWLNLARVHWNELDVAFQHQETVPQPPVSVEVPISLSENIEVSGFGSGSGSGSDNGQGDERDDVDYDDNDGNDIEGDETGTDAISDHAITLLCESCPKLQLLDLSYISSITNAAIEALSESATSLVCLTIIGCPRITSQSLVHLAKLRRTSGKLGCITMGDALGISERDIEEIMRGTLSGWQKSLVDETNLGEILGRSWDE